MHTDISILNVYFLIVLVATNPTFQKVLPRTHPEVHCEEIGNRKALTDAPKYEERNENIISRILTPNQISPTCQASQENYLPCNILKLVYNKILHNPITKDIKQNNDADLLEIGQIPSYIPNVVNNYILIPSDSLYNDIKTITNYDYPECSSISPKFCTRVKKNADENIHNKLKSNPGSSFTEKKTIHDDNKNRTTAQKISDVSNAKNVYSKVVTGTTDTNDYQREHLKKSPKRHSQNKNRINTDLEEFSVNENKNYEASEKKNSHKKKEINENTSKLSHEVGNKKYLNNNAKKSISSNEINQISEKDDIKTYDQPNKQRQQLKKIRVDKNMKKDQLKEKNPEYPKEKRINPGNKNRNENERYFPFGPSFQWPNIPYDDDMYRYMNSFLSNYQMPNTKLSNGSPFNYNNIYQFSQPPYPWSKKNTRKSKLYRRKKHRYDYKKRLNKKRLNTRKKHTGKKVISAIIENDNFETTTPAISLKTLITSSFDPDEKIRENLKLPEYLSTNEKVTYTEEPDTTINLDNLTSHNNMSVDEAFNFNSHPSFIIGMEGNVPIIFENGLIDDYYPDFTADNKILDNKETLPSKYHGDKYHYVSNQLIDFEDYIKARKRLVLKNMNKSSNFLFSDNDVIREVEPKTSKDEKEAKSVVKFQSPPLLDNPDFRTRKIDSNEKYEPYYYHNTSQDPEEDFNKYSIDDKSVVYSSTTLSKHMKNKLLNDIDDDTKSKWKKVKDSNVETVHARSKLAKYGFIF